MRGASLARIRENTHRPAGETGTTATRGVVSGGFGCRLPRVHLGGSQAWPIRGRYGRLGDDVCGRLGRPERRTNIEFSGGMDAPAVAWSTTLSFRRTPVDVGRVTERLPWRRRSMPEPLLTRYMQPLLAGRRAECFELIADAYRAGECAEDLIRDVVWPSMAQIDRLYRDDRINTAVEHMALRINRTVADQLQAGLPRSPRRGKRIILTCAAGTLEELGAQMVADLFQSDGWEVYFPGGGVPHDETLGMVGQIRPEVLVVFGTQPEGVPDTRRLVELIREIGVCPTMNIVVSGGIYDRADGLWQEVGADAYAESARGLLQLVNELGPREPHAPRLGIVKKRRRRRKSKEASVSQQAAGAC